MTTRREFIHKAALAGAGIGLLGSAGCSDDVGPGVADALPDEGVADGGSMMDARPPMTDGRPPMMDGRPPMMDGRPPMMDGRPPMMDGRPPMMDGRPPTLDGRPPRVDGAPMVLCRVVSARISVNHGHELMVPPADVRAGVEMTYDIAGRADHAHTVTVTAAHFAVLLTGRGVTVSSTAGVSHSHEVSLRCVSGITPMPMM